MQDSLKKALKDETLTVPEPFKAQLGQITEILRKLAGRLEIKNADERRQVRPRQAVLHSAEFKELWDRIKHKTTYRVQFDNEELVENCIRRAQRCAAYPQDPLTVAQGRYRHRQRLESTRQSARAPQRLCWTKPTSSCRMC